MEQLAIDCKFLYVTIISTNNSKCNFFTVYEINFWCISCMLAYPLCSVSQLYILGQLWVSYIDFSVQLLAFTSCFYKHVNCFRANKHGWMDGWMDGLCRPPHLRNTHTVPGKTFNPLMHEVAVLFQICSEVMSSLGNHSSWLHSFK